MAKEELGMKITLEADANNLQQALRKLQSDLTSINKQGKSLKDALKFDSSNATTYAKVIDNLKSKQSTLSSILTTSKDRLSALNEQYSQSGTRLNALKSLYSSQENALTILTQKYGENSEQVQTMQAIHELTKEKLDKETDTFEDLERQISATNKKYNETDAELTKTTAELSKYEKTTEDSAEATEKAADSEKEQKEQLEAEAKAAAEAELQNSNLNETFTQMDAIVANLVSSAIKKLISSMKDLATEVVEVGSGFEDGLNGLSAILQVSSDSYTIKDLADYFEELGTQSAYSATEIANNAQILANAGYESDEIKSSIKVIGDLAAGTGEEFETMANVVVDGLAAFGMSADEATRFSDALAKSAISSNTNVTQMGEAFKYVGSVAGTMGYSVESVGVALGAMANQGVKASNAGTTLRSIISRLATNTSEARDTLEELGVSFYDADGNARELIGSLGADGVAGTADDTTGVLDELREAMSGLNDEQKSTIEKTIAGQKGLAGLAAIVNTSTDDWNKLKEEVQDCNGTVEQMADTRLDSYSGDVKKLQNQWEQTASTMYQEVEPALREVIQALTKLMKTDFFKKDIKKIASGFADALEKVADVISNLNPTTIATVSSLAKAVTTFAATTVVVNKTTKAINGVVNTFSGFKSLGTVLSTTMSEATTTGGVLSGVLSVLGNNIGLVATGIGLATSAFVLFTNGLKEAQEAHMEEINSLYGLDDATEEVIEDINSLSESYTALKETTEENATSIMNEYDYYENLASEYDNIIAKGEAMTETDQNRANVILDTLSEALGIEKTQLEEQITAEGNLSNAIAQTIEMKKADALLTVYQEQYAQAIQNVSTAQAEQTALLQAQQEQQAQVNELTTQATTLHDQLANSEGLTSQQAQQLTYDYQEVLGALSVAQSGLQETDDALATNKATLEDSQATISNYEALVSASSSGSADAVETAVNRMTTNFKTANDASLETLRTQTANYKTQWETAKTEFDSGSGAVTQTEVDMYKALYDMSKEETNKAAKQMKEYGQNQTDGAKEGVEDGTPALVKAAQKTAEKANKGYKTAAGVNSPSTIWNEYGVYQAEGAINGLKSMKSKLAKTAADLATAANEAYQTTLDIGSPSRVMYQNGVWTAEGAINGMDSQMTKMAQKGREMAQTMNDSINGYIDGESSSSYSRQRAENIVVRMAESENNRTKLDKIVNLLESYLPEQTTVYMDGELVSKKIEKIQKRSNKLNNKIEGIIV